MEQEYEVLFCCPKCRGILNTKEAFKEHQATCDGTVDKSTCAQFVCDKTSLLQKDSDDDKESKGNGESGVSKMAKRSSATNDAVKRPKRAAAVKLLKTWESNKIKSEKSEIVSREKVNDEDALVKIQPRKPFAHNKERNEKQNDMSRKRRKVMKDEDSKSEKGNLIYVEIINEETGTVVKKEENEDKDINLEKNGELEEEKHSTGIKLEQISTMEFIEDKENEDFDSLEEKEEESQQGPSLDSCPDTAVDEQCDSDSVAMDDTTTSETPKPMKRKKKFKMDKLMIQFIKSGKLLPAPEKKESSDDELYEEEPEYEPEYEEIQPKKRRKPRKSKLGKPMFWSVEYRAEYNRMKEMYRQYYVPTLSINDESEKWERLPGFYQCPKCPFKMKKVSAFHKHMTEWHKEGEDEGNENTDTPKKEFDPMEKYDPSVHVSRTFYQRRRAEWAQEYEKYVVHSEDGLFSHYQCPACEYVSKVMGHFHRHISRIHTSLDGTVDGRVEMWKCELCDFETIRKPTLKQHMLVHNRPFLCEYCPRRFGNKKNLADHVMLHEGINPRQCPYCDYTTRQKRCLEEHMRKHTGELLQCEFCEFETPYYAGLKMHVITKHKEKTLYPCKEPDCEYVTNDKTSFSKHMALHNGKKEFQCSHCDYQGVTKYEVIKHLKSVHENQKMFYCDRCDYSSAYSTAFRNHLMVHLDLRPYACSHCDYSAPQKTRVDLHVKSKHPNDEAKTVVTENYQIDITPYKRPSGTSLYRMFCKKMKEHEQKMSQGDSASGASSVVLDSSEIQQITQMDTDGSGDMKQQYILVNPHMNFTLDDVRVQEEEDTKQEILQAALEEAKVTNFKSVDPKPGQFVMPENVAVKGEDGFLPPQEELPNNKQVVHQQVDDAQPGTSKMIAQYEVGTTDSENQQEVSVEQDGNGSTYTYQIVDPQGQMHYVEVSHPLEVDENIVFVTEPTEQGESQTEQTSTNQ